MRRALKDSACGCCKKKRFIRKDRKVVFFVICFFIYLYHLLGFTGLRQLLGGFGGLCWTIVFKGREKVFVIHGKGRFISRPTRKYKSKGLPTDGTKVEWVDVCVGSAAKRIPLIRIPLIRRWQRSTRDESLDFATILSLQHGSKMHRREWYRNQDKNKAPKPNM